MENIILKESKFGFQETVRRVKNYIENNGFKIFCIVDHAGAANNAGLKLDNTVLFIFGNPKAGTILMQGTRLMGLELPLKLLVYEENNKTFVSYFGVSEFDKFNIKERNILKNIETFYEELIKDTS